MDAEAAFASQTHDVARTFATLVDMIGDRGLQDRAAVEELELFRDKRLPDVLSDARPVFHFDFARSNLRVIYNMHAKFRVQDVKKLLDHDGWVVMIVRERPGTLALKGIGVGARAVEVFDVRELMFNCTRHILVPKHEPIRDDASIEDVMKQTRVRSKYQLPLILVSDPIARYLALRPGELVRITRASPSAGESVTYRCCMRA
jgi:DNA-directed RNA polymerase subunit H (RpoH/RPB5)